MVEGQVGQGRGARRDGQTSLLLSGDLLDARWRLFSPAGFGAPRGPSKLACCPRLPLPGEVGSVRFRPAILVSGHQTGPRGGLMKRASLVLTLASMSLCLPASASADVNTGKVRQSFTTFNPCTSEVMAVDLTRHYMV